MDLDESKESLQNHFKACAQDEIEIEKAHRSNTRNKSAEKGKARPIYAEFVTWQDSKYIIQNANKISNFHANSSNEKSVRNHIQQFYGKKTAEERGEMLKLRKYFMLENPTWKISLTYPAILRINKGNGYSKYNSNESDLGNADEYFTKIDDDDDLRTFQENFC